MSLFDPSELRPKFSGPMRGSVGRLSTPELVAQHRSSVAMALALRKPPAGSTQSV